MPDTPSPDDKFRAIEQASFTFAETRKRSLIDGIIAESKVQSARHKPVRDAALAFLATVDEFKAVAADDPRAAEKKAEIMGRMETSLGTFGDKLKSPALKKAVQDLLASDTFKEQPQPAQNPQQPAQGQGNPQQQPQPGFGNLPLGGITLPLGMLPQGNTFPGLPGQGATRPGFAAHDEGGNHTPEEILRELDAKTVASGRTKISVIDAIRNDAGNNELGFRAPAQRTAAMETVQAYDDLRQAMASRNRPGMAGMIDALAERLEQNFDNYAQIRGGGQALDDLMKRVNHQPGYTHPPEAKQEKYTTDSPEYGRLVILSQAGFSPNVPQLIPNQPAVQSNIMQYVQQATITPGNEGRRRAAEEVMQAYRLAQDVRNHADEPWSGEAAASTMAVLQSALGNFAKQRGNDRNFNEAVRDLLKSDDYRNPAQYLQRQQQQQPQLQGNPFQQPQQQGNSLPQQLFDQLRRGTGGFRSGSTDAPPSDEMLAALDQYNTGRGASGGDNGGPNDLPSEPFMTNGRGSREV